jgi:hypothetical protein
MRSALHSSVIGMLAALLSSATLEIVAATSAWKSSEEAHTRRRKKDIMRLERDDC